MIPLQVYIGIGSNIDRENNIRNGLLELGSYYGELEISPIYESSPVGFQGDGFLNLVVRFKTVQQIDDVEKRLHKIESQFGRKQDQRRYFPRTLDIDLLLYGDLVCVQRGLPRGDILKYAFVLKPLYDLAPNLVHPVSGLTISQLWDEFESVEQQIKQINTTVTI